MSDEKKKLKEKENKRLEPGANKGQSEAHTPTPTLPHLGEHKMGEGDEEKSNASETRVSEVADAGLKPAPPKENENGE